MNSAGLDQPPLKPPPLLQYDRLKALPVVQLKSLKTHYQLLTQHINDLINIVHGYGDQAGPSWPDLLAKYNIILQQTALISQQLSIPYIPSGSHTAAILAQQSQAGNWPQPPHNQLPHTLIHPTLPVPSQELEFYLTSLLQTARPPGVLAADEEAVAQLGHGFEGLQPPAILDKVKAIREEHDQRWERASRAVNLLKTHPDYVWKARPDFNELQRQYDDIISQEKGLKDRNAAENMSSRSSEQDGEDQVEEHITVDREQSEQPANTEMNGVESNDDAPLGSGDELFVDDDMEEVA